MYIIVSKQDKRIIETLASAEIVDSKWVKTAQNSLIQLDTVDVVEVESVLDDAEYYKDESFLTEVEHEKLQKRPAYIARVKQLVREKYSDADTELAILRKHSAGIDVNGEFEAYNEYVESCKAQAKAELVI